MTELLDKKELAADASATDLQTDAAELEVMVAQALGHLDNSYAALREDEQSLEAFLEEYHRSVGPWFEVLDKMRQEIRVGGSVSTRRDAVEGAGGQDVLNKEIDQEIKSLYRKLIKLYHPDTQAAARKLPPEEKQMIQVINTAYARKDLTALRRIEFDAFRRQVARVASAEETVRCLSARYDVIIASSNRVADRRRMLRASPAWQLKMQMEKARIEGKDAIAPIVARVQAQIEQTAQELGAENRDSEALKLLRSLKAA